MDIAQARAMIPTRWLVTIAGFQGVALLLLHNAIEASRWPAEDPPLLLMLYTLTIAMPVMWLLGLRYGAIARTLLMSGVFALLIASASYYVGTQVAPVFSRYAGGAIFILVVTLSVATFKALLYLQAYGEQRLFSYPTLFLYSWRNFLTLVGALLFTLLTWGVLMLWAKLFSAIQIDFFYDLFTQHTFFYPVLALAHGIGVVVLRQQFDIIDTVTRIQQVLIKILLVVLAFVSLIFLATLPFTGLSVLWESGGSSLILWMQALVLFFANAVYQADHAERPYALWLHRFVMLCIVLLPIYSVISYYGLSLRIEQHGWSVMRGWAFLLWGILAAFSVGYSIGVLRYRDHWLHLLGYINTLMGIVILVMMLLVNSPWLDFRKIAANSQVERLTSGIVAIADFDYHYLYRDLAKPGRDALTALRESWQTTHPAMVAKLDELARRSPSDDDLDTPTKEAFVLMLNDHGALASASDDLLDALYQAAITERWFYHHDRQYHLIALDLTADQTAEYVLVDSHGYDMTMTLFYRHKDQWLTAQLSEPVVPYSERQAWIKTLREQLQNKNYRAVKPQWQDLRIGDTTFRISSDRPEVE